MKSVVSQWAARFAALIFGYFVTGVLAGRIFWDFIEKKIDPEALRSAVNSIGEVLGLGRITSLDSRLQAIERVVDFLSFPWALLGSALALLTLEWLLLRCGEKSGSDSN
jgi:hypothetical protein